jgi:hypothetical protein
MNTRKHSSLRIALFAGLVLFAATNQGSAAGTAVGTSVSNQASITYQVSGVPQTGVTSNAYAFVVDRKINLTVVTTDSSAVVTAAGATASVLTFTVQNTGNGVQDFALAAVTQSGGAAAFTGTDNVDAAGVQVFVDTNTNGTYDAGTDVGTFIDELAADATRTVFIVGDFSTGTYANGDIATYHLSATARAGGTASSLGSTLTQTSGADTPETVDIVFADAAGSATGDSARDGAFTDNSDYRIAAANLTVTKSSAVISDPSNGTTNAKAIPGAVIEYTVLISNAAGAATASNISFTDSLNSEIGANRIAFVADGYASGQGIRVTAPNINSGSPLALTNGSGDDAGDWNVTASNTVTVAGIQLAAGESATVTFRVTVQ